MRAFASKSAPVEDLTDARCCPEAPAVPQVPPKADGPALPQDDGRCDPGVAARRGGDRTNDGIQDTEGGVGGMDVAEDHIESDLIDLTGVTLEELASVDQVSLAAPVERLVREIDRPSSSIGGYSS